MERVGAQIDQHRSGFTLVELMVVLLIMGLIAGVVALRFHGVVAGARGEVLMDRIENLDATARSHARLHGDESTIWFDLERQQVRVIHDEAADQAQTGGSIVEFDGRWRLVAVHTAETSSRGGQVPIAMASTGFGSDYVLEMTDQGGNVRWLTVAGLTGATKREDGRDVSALALMEVWRGE